MNKKTLTAIMYGVVIVLVIAVGVVTVKLATRPEIVVAEEESSSAIIANTISNFYEESSEEVNISDLITRVKVIDDNVNVRVQPTTDADRLGSAYYGNTFDYVSQSHDGWTKIIYDGKEAYIFSDYVELIPMVINVEGDFTEFLGADAPKPEEMVVWSDEGEGGDADTDSDTDTAEDNNENN